jgi:uncharacterized protein YjiS (DUF1127 family)
MQLEKVLPRDRFLLTLANHGEVGRRLPMSATAQNDASLARRRWIASIASPLLNLPSRICRALETRQAIEELEALDDGTLADIGISRCQIRSVARHGVQRG